MNSQEKQKRVNETMSQYHTPGCSKDTHRPKNAIFQSAKNSPEHEAMKSKLCHEFLIAGIPFITEAVRNESDGSGKERRPDIVNLVTGDEIEIETTMRRAVRFIDDDRVIIIPVGWDKKSDAWHNMCLKARGKGI